MNFLFSMPNLYKILIFKIYGFTPDCQFDKKRKFFTEGHFYQLLQTINMKTKYFALLIAAMGSSLSLGASISNLESAYSKNSTVYNGTNGDTLNVSTPTTLNVNADGSWTMAFTVSNLTATSDSNVGLLFTYNTTKSYYNLEGMGYQLAEDGTLTLNVGGFNYNRGTAASSPWENANVFRLFRQHAPDPVLHIQQGNCFYLRHAGG